MDNPIIVYDACALYPAPLRDLPMYHLVAELMLAEGKAIVERGLGADATNEVVAQIMTVTGGVHRQVDMILRRILDLKRRNRQKLEQGEINLHDIIAALITGKVKGGDYVGREVRDPGLRYARIIAEESGSITDTQDALGHRNAATTRIHVQRIAVKKDKYSDRITRRIQRSKAS
jgi:hypothetical protein